jgi:hypothetical protein
VMHLRINVASAYCTHILPWQIQMRFSHSIPMGTALHSIRFGNCCPGIRCGCRFLLHACFSFLHEIFPFE